jgi:hypothetical protein
VTQVSGWFSKLHKSAAAQLLLRPEKKNKDDCERALKVKTMRKEGRKKE